MSSPTTGVLRGRCHKFGHDIALDGGVMPVRFAMAHEFDAATLIPHLFEEIAPGFADRAQRGDIIIAGRSFCKGRAHAQGFIALAALGVGILCQSMPFYSYRGAVSRGIPCNRNCAGILDMATGGDDIEMDYAAGRFRNHTRGTETSFPAIEPGVLKIMTGGGMYGMLRDWRDARAQPERLTQN